MCARSPFVVLLAFCTLHMFRADFTVTLRDTLLLTMGVLFVDMNSTSG